MHQPHRFAISLLGLAIGCAADVAGTTGDAATGSTGSASNSDTGVQPSPTESGGATSSGSDGASTANFDPGDTAASGSSDTGGSSSTGVGESSSSGGPPAVCGDGQLDPGEACDDGNAVEFDGCLATCALGPGALVEQHALPPVGLDEYRRCFTAIDPQQLPGEGFALVFGSTVGKAGPKNQTAARVQQLRFPGLVAPEWAYLEWAGPYSRMMGRMITAPNGDVIVAGFVSTEAVKVDSGGYLWLARFTAGGALVWSEDLNDVWIWPAELQLAPDGDIVLVGVPGGLGGYSRVLRFHGDGTLVWAHVETEQPNSIRHYRGLALDDDGNIFVLGVQREFASEQTSTVLLGFGGDGDLLWSKVYAPPAGLGVTPADLVWTPDDRLVASVNEYDLANLESEPQFVLAAFDTTGDTLWWKHWGTGQPNPVHAGVLLANDDGSVHAIGGQSGLEGDDTVAALASRFDADGALVWALLTPGAGGSDALHGPDGRLYLLAKDAVLVYEP